MRILLSAYACQPRMGSELGAGWSFASAAALRNDVWLLTRAAYAGPIEEELRRNPELRLTPVYCDVPFLASALWKLPKGEHLYYFCWQLAAGREARRLHASTPFDVAHHVTWAIDWMPAPPVCIDGLPSVWGPVGGTTGSVPSLWRWLGWRGAAAEIVRSSLGGAARSLFGDRVARRATLVVAQNSDVARRFARANVVVEPNVAIESPSDLVPGNRSPGDPRRALFVGRLVGWKGIGLAIAAMAEPAAAEWVLDVIGDGPDADRCRRLVERLGLGDRVRFLGARSRDEVFAEYRSADCLLFPSLHDSAPWSVGEALVHGLPVVCLDRGGPGDFVTAGRGERVPARGDVVGALGAALGRINGRIPPVRGFGEDRLPAMLESWYQRVVADAGGEIAVSPPAPAGRP